MGVVGSYRNRLTEGIGSGWRRFWFTPSDPLPLCVLRIAVGLVALYYVASFTTDLNVWFADDGLLPAHVVRTLTGADDPSLSGPADYRYSYLYFLDTPGELWAAHLAGLVVVAAFTIGLASRVTSVLSLVVVLSYVNRAPMLSGPLEPVLTMALLYLCIAPTGARLSIDRLLSRARQRANPPTAAQPQPDSRLSIAATISVRLIQVHLAGFYAVMVLNQLGGLIDFPYSGTWWRGEAVWWLIARPESRLVDLTFLYSAPYLINAWTHAIVLFELAFPILVWNRLARPLLLALAVPIWGSLALASGEVSFCVMMLVANLAFLSPEALRGVGAWALRRPQ
jgi:hypothetical protein